MQVTGLTNATQVAAGERFSLAVITPQPGADIVRQAPYPAGAGVAPPYQP